MEFIHDQIQATILIATPGLLKVLDLGATQTGVGVLVTLLDEQLLLKKQIKQATVGIHTPVIRDLDLHFLEWFVEAGFHHLALCSNALNIRCLVTLLIFLELELACGQHDTGSENLPLAT